MTKLSRQAHSGTGTWRDGLVVKFMIGKQGIVYRISPWILLACLLVLGAGGRVLAANQHAREQALKTRIAELEEEKRAAHTFLQRKEREKKQALALAQMRSDELWDELRARDQQKYGNPDGPTFTQLVNKARTDGLQGDAVYESIIGSSQRTDEKTNQKLGVSSKPDK